MLLTGNVLDQFWSPRLGSCNSLEQTLYQELNDKFLMLRVDAASGVSFYDTADEQELLKVCHLADRIASKGQRLGDLQEKIAQTQHQPLPTLILVRAMSDAVTRLWPAINALTNRSVSCCSLPLRSFPRVILTACLSWIDNAWSPS